MAKARDHIEAQEAIEAFLAELSELPPVVDNGVMRRDEVVRRAVRHDDLAALRPEPVETLVRDVHDGRGGRDPRLVLSRIESQRVEFRIARDDVFDRRIARAVEQRLHAGERIRGL